VTASGVQAGAGDHSGASGDSAAAVPIAPILWQPAVRIVPTRFPSINLFDRVASPEDFDALYAVEALTNDRLRNEVGEISLVPPEERQYGAGSGPIMAAFTHLNPLGSRFSDGSYGVFYAAADRATAIAETQYHQGRFLRATDEGPLQLQMRVYHVDVAGALHDLREWPDAAIYDPLDYGASRVLGKRLRLNGSLGVCYRSVRRAEGQCIGAFRPGVLTRCRHAAQLLYQWTGEGFDGVFEKIQ
jgi:hypothetical protein